MNTPQVQSAADEINRLHGEVNRTAEDSQKLLHVAARAAWEAGKLLNEEQVRVRRTMGAAWGLWLDNHFHGTPRTAQNYMALAYSIEDVSQLKGLSLRQVYLRLGISTEPKSLGKQIPVPPLPSHVRLANRLLVALGSCAPGSKASPQRSAAYRQDLRALYDRLRSLFEQ